MAEDNVVPFQRPSGSAPFPGLIEIGDFIGHAPPDRLFLDRDRLLPMRNVVLLGGDGGTGKSLLALQLALACTTVLQQWIGIDVDHGPVLYLSAEDDRDELHKRINEIVDAESGDMESGRGMLYFMPLAGLDATLAMEQKGNVTLVKTKLFGHLDRALQDVAPVLLVLDNVADIYGGNENNRSQVKFFIGILRQLAIRHDCVVLLLGHPSLSGLASGSGMSGSTAWSNSVRSRLYLTKPAGADGDSTDENARVLEVKKSNYTLAGKRFDLNWHDGRFVRANLRNAWDRLTVEDIDRVRAVFRGGYHRVNEQSGEWGGFAVAELLDMDVGRGVGAKERTKEQNKNRADIRTYLAGWLRAGSIHVVTSMTAKREPAQFYSDRPDNGAKP